MTINLEEPPEASKTQNAAKGVFSGRQTQFEDSNMSNKGISGGSMSNFADNVDHKLAEFYHKDLQNQNLTHMRLYLLRCMKYLGSQLSQLEK